MRNTIQFALVAVCVAGAAGESRSVELCLSTPEAQGIDSGVLSRGLKEVLAGSRGLHSLLAVRNDCLILEAYWPPYNRDRKHYLNSATKAVLSALAGIASRRGQMREGDLV